MKRYVPKDYRPKDWNVVFVKMMELVRKEVGAKELVKIEPTIRGRICLVWALLTSREVDLNSPYFTFYYK